MKPDVSLDLTNSMLENFLHRMVKIEFSLKVSKVKFVLLYSHTQLKLLARFHLMRHLNSHKSQIQQYCFAK